VASHALHEEDSNDSDYRDRSAQGTHVAVAIGDDERVLAQLEVPADRCQTRPLLVWATPLGEERTWAIESAAGLGKLLSQERLLNPA
jgi:hypothetical protein